MFREMKSNVDILMSKCAIVRLLTNRSQRSHMDVTHILQKGLYIKCPLICVFPIRFQRITEDNFVCIMNHMYIEDNFVCIMYNESYNESNNEVQSLICDPVIALVLQCSHVFKLCIFTMMKYSTIVNSCNSYNIKYSF